ncbi:hypothetical protein BDM02DRAFT_3124021 [Thelephora ganbajun]|uniref:Uncharacterized protein n=1 Tax=Thelephora ganbajun TaxID=370292 RepID=A0ACB6YZU5_THEGA|nr:hypothetical protein BDM02DRAFT_3124021 [Thelephora ganbajun]
MEVSIGGVALMVIGIALVSLPAKHRRLKQEVLSQMTRKVSPPVSQMPQPFAYTQTETSPITSLHPLSELP